MTEHDRMCPQHGQTMRSIIAFDTPCRCEFIDRVRADERATAQVQACDAHISQVRWAEAVATRLVEVIVRDAIEISNLHGEIKQGVADWYAMKDERDAARAEVAALREQADRYDSVIATLMVRLHDEVLADLRAKVEGMGLCVERDDGDECLCGPVEFNSARVTLDKVLDLIAEAGHD